MYLCDQLLNALQPFFFKCNNINSLSVCTTLYCRPCHVWTVNEIIDRSADILTSLEQKFFSIFIESFIYVRLYHKNKICAGVEMYANDYRNLIGECSNRVEYIPERSSSGLNRLAASASKWSKFNSLSKYGFFFTLNRKLYFVLISNFVLFVWVAYRATTCLIYSSMLHLPQSGKDGVNILFWAWRQVS